ncbi:FAD-dependent monooxygenase, partial [Staphylococcus arlettae]
LAIADNSGTALSKIKLKRNTVNLTLERQSLLETIQSYVQPSSIYTGYQVLSIENEVNKVTVHFENHEAETFDLCI